MFTETPTAREPYPAPAPARPQVRQRPLDWARANLFSSPANSVVTVLFGALAAWAVSRGVRFVFVTADWEIVRRNLTTFMVGLFPRDQLWRPWVALGLLTAVAGFASGVAGATAARQAAVDATAAESDAAAGPGTVVLEALQRWWPLVLLVVAVLSLTRTLGPTLLVLGALALLVAAREAGRRAPRPLVRFSWLVVLVGLVGAWLAVTAFDGVPWDDWGGLLLTAFVTVAGIVLAFPLGLAMALGRRSTLPAVKSLSVVYIEFVRGVPLITLLLMGQFMLGFFFPRGFSTPGVLARALIVIVLFEGAYIAEVVRGGLQAVPRGQYEAAQALGLSPWRQTRLVILPQALRAVIPAMVGQFISLYKDTSLLAIVGFFELLAVAQAVTSQPDFLGQGLHSVTLAFVGFVYWVGSYTMSRESRRIERRVGVGER